MISYLSFEPFNFFPVTGLSLPESFDGRLLCLHSLLFIPNALLKFTDFRFSLKILFFLYLSILALHLLILILKLLYPVLHGFNVELQLLFNSNVFSDIRFKLLDQVLVHFGARTVLLRVG